MGGCQNYGPFFGTVNIRCRIIIGTQKGTIILTTNHMGLCRLLRVYIRVRGGLYGIMQVATGFYSGLGLRVGI